MCLCGFGASSLLSATLVVTATTNHAYIFSRSSNEFRFSTVLVFILMFAATMFVWVYYFNVKRKLSAFVSVCVINVPCIGPTVLMSLFLLLACYCHFTTTFRQKTQL